MEEIINRGGGNLMVQLYNTDENENLIFDDFKEYVLLNRRQ